MRRIGLLMPLAADDPIGQARVAALREGLEKLGWIEGRNIRIDTRWMTTGDVESMQRFAKERSSIVQRSRSARTTTHSWLSTMLPHYRRPPTN
jgi:hypothetical protein